MKKFFVSKDDNNRVAFIEKTIQSINPSSIYILCEKDREYVYRHIENATILPLKELNKNSNWITFINNFDANSLLIIDNVLKFIFFGDGKKAYLKNVSQKINNIIVTDVVPFYTDTAEMFYPFWFLGKEILGYNSYNSFKANHMEEKQDGSIDKSHSFAVLKDKIKDYYVQDYNQFFNLRNIINWAMESNEFEIYEKNKKEKVELIKNPINMMTIFADYINLLPSKINSIANIINGKTAIVLNYMPYEKKIRLLLPIFNDNNVVFESYHSKDYRRFSQYDTVIFYDNILVKPHNIFYIEPYLKGLNYVLLESKVNLDKMLFNRVYNIELRNQFDKYFGNEQSL